MRHLAIALGLVALVTAAPGEKNASRKTTLTDESRVERTRSHAETAAHRSVDDRRPRRELTELAEAGDASYLQRFAGCLRSRHLRWQWAHDVLSVSLISMILF